MQSLCNVDIKSVFKTPPFSNISQSSQMHKAKKDMFRAVDAFKRQLEQKTNGSSDEGILLIPK